jgi:hypothetical protein
MDVREFCKIPSPSKCRSIEIHETGSRNSCREKVQIYEKRVKWRVLMSFGCFTSFWTNMKIMAELGPCIRTFNLFQDERFPRKSRIRRSRKSGIMKSQKSGIRKSQKSGIMNQQSSGITDLRNYASRFPIRESWMRVRKSERSQVKDATSKSPVWRAN